MTTAEALRSERIQRLHRGFLDASDKYPRVFHFAAKWSTLPGMNELLPWAESRDEFPEQWESNPISPEHHKQNLDDLWSHVFENLATDLSLWAVDHHVMTFQGERWIGVFGIERNDERDLQPRPEIDLFAELAAKAANEFTDPVPPRNLPQSGWLSLKFDPTDSRWMSQVYSALSPGKVQVQTGLSAMTLPSDVFTASSQAVERLVTSRTMPVVTPNVSNAGEPWPFDDGWHFRPQEAAYLGHAFPISGKPKDTLQVLASARRGLTIIEIRDEVSPDSQADADTIRGYLSEVRTVLRREFIVNRDTDRDAPVVRKGKIKGKDALWSLDSKTILRPTNFQR